VKLEEKEDMQRRAFADRKVLKKLGRDEEYVAHQRGDNSPRIHTNG